MARQAVRFSRLSSRLLSVNGLDVAIDRLTSSNDIVNAVKLALPVQPVFRHQNRDGSIAVAIGREPDLWPEDEPRVTDR